MDNEFCNRVKHIAVLNVLPKGWTKEVNLVDWNHHGVKFDIRDWSPDHSNVSKGITLTRSETIELAKYLDVLDFSLISERQKKNENKNEEDEIICDELN